MLAFWVFALSAFLPSVLGLTVGIDRTSCGPRQSYVGRRVSDASARALDSLNGGSRYLLDRLNFEGGKKRTVIDVAIDYFAKSVTGSESTADLAYGEIVYISESKRAITILCGDSGIFSIPSNSADAALYNFFLPGEMLVSKKYSCSDSSSTGGRTQGFTILSRDTDRAWIVICPRSDSDANLWTAPDAGSYDYYHKGVESWDSISFTILHELMHAGSSVVTDSKDPVSGQVAYGWRRVTDLARRGKSEDIVNNAETLTFVCEGIYYITDTRYDWSTGYARTIPSAWADEVVPN